MGCGASKKNRVHAAAPQPKPKKAATAVETQYEIGVLFCKTPSRPIWDKMYDTYNSDRPLDEYCQKHKSQFEQQLQEGVPSEYRWEAWLAALNLQNYEIPQINGTVTDDISRIIELDLSRTYCTMPYFASDEGIDQLRQVLSRYAALNPNVGYVQGFNYIVALFLLASGGDADATLKAFCYVMRHFQRDDFYTDGMAGLHTTLAIFDKVFSQKWPKISEHFENEGFSSALWVTKWFITFFTYDASFEFIVRVWDHVVIEGVLFIYKLAIAIWQYQSDYFLAQDLGGLVEAMKEFTSNPSVEVIEQVLAKARTIEVTETMIKNFEK